MNGKTLWQLSLTITLIALLSACGSTPNSTLELSGLKNFQKNTPALYSSGLPSKEHLLALKHAGVNQVIDLIPEHREKEQSLVEQLGMTYHNIEVDWQAPSLADFDQYVSVMAQQNGKEGKTLTHCRLNWRGAVFIYLYRVTVLHHDPAIAQTDMLAIWQPNPTWQTFIDDVLKSRS